MLETVRGALEIVKKQTNKQKNPKTEIATSSVMMMMMMMCSHENPSVVCSLVAKRPSNMLLNKFYDSISGKDLLRQVCVLTH